MTLVCGADHVIETACPYTYTRSCSDDVGKVVYSVTAQPGQPISLTKYLAYHTSRRASAAELCERTEWTLDRAKRDGFAKLMAGQRQYMDDFWRRSDVHIEGALLRDRLALA